MLRNLPQKAHLKARANSPAVARESKSQPLRFVATLRTAPVTTASKAKAGYWENLLLKTTHKIHFEKRFLRVLAGIIGFNRKIKDLQKLLDLGEHPEILVCL